MAETLHISHAFSQSQTSDDDLNIQLVNFTTKRSCRAEVLQHHTSICATWSTKETIQGRALHQILQDLLRPYQALETQMVRSAPRACTYTWWQTKFKSIQSTWKKQASPSILPLHYKVICEGRTASTIQVYLITVALQSLNLKLQFLTSYQQAPFRWKWSSVHRMGSGDTCYVFQGWLDQIQIRGYRDT